MTIIGDEIQEIISELKLPPLVDSDITIQKIATESGVGENAIRALMKKKVASGEYSIVWKRGMNNNRIATYTKMVQ